MTEHEESIVETILDFTNTIIGSTGIDELFSRVTRLLPSILPFKRTAAYRYNSRNNTVVRLVTGDPADTALLSTLAQFPFSGSHVEKAARSGLPTVFMTDDPVIPRSASVQFAQVGIRTILVLPLFADEELIGSFHVGREEVAPLTAKQEILLSRIASQVALALRDVLRMETLRKLEEEQERLIAITNALVAEVEPNRLFTTIAQHLRALYPVQSFGVAFYSKESDAFERGTVMTEEGTILSVEAIPRQGTFFEELCAAGTARFLPPDEVEKGLQRFISLRDSSTSGRSQAVLLPMYDRAKEILAVAAATMPPDHRFTDDDMPFLNRLGAQIGLAIENMQAYREIKLLRLRLEQEGRYLKEEINDTFNVTGLIYASAAVANVMRAVEKAAVTDATVLLMGETGTGKELFARTIHAKSHYMERALVKVNCGAIPSGLIESHLFGHEKGSFTGAVNQHIGVFEVADGGTIFLDEIAELPLDMQVKLLRVLQEGEITRVGGTTSLCVRVRVIAATNRMIEHMVEKGTFRSDLYYRLAVVPILIPPLRERPEDIPLLATFFVNKYAERFRKPVKRISPEAMSRLRSYAFPGNVRELENLIERAVVLSDARTLGAEMFPLSLTRSFHENKGGNRDHGSDSENERILATLRECNWIIEGNRGAAKKLNLKPSTLRSRMAKLGIRRKED